MKKLAIIGYGALGSIVAKSVVSKLKSDYKLLGVYDHLLEQDSIVVESEKIPVYKDIEELLEDDSEIVVEIAGVKAVKDYSKDILRSKKDLVLTSVGALADEELCLELEKTAKENKKTIHLISGAIGGVDALLNLKTMGGGNVTMETTKNPKGLEGAPSLQGRKPSASEKELVFEGSAKEAIKGFPENTNSGVTASLASVGPDKLRIKLVSDPKQKGNAHRITGENELFSFEFKVTAKPDSENPKSSVTAAHSVITLLENMVKPIRFF